MRVALDATYSVDPYPTGIAVYSGALLNGLAARYPGDVFLRYYRWKQWRRAHSPRRLLLPPPFGGSADIFHGLNQRADYRPARGVVTTFHDLFVLSGDYSTAEFRKRFAAQARAAARNSDFIIAVSAFTAGQVRGLLGFDAARIVVIPHGVALAARAETIPRKKIVLFVGALQLRKNLQRLLGAFRSLPADWRLVLAGAPSGYGASEILAQIGSSPVHSRIEVRGYVSGPEREQLYRCASIFAFPSLDEGFGMPVLEAMAQGLPVITSNRSALPEVAGTAALLVDPLSEDELANALVMLGNDEGLWRQLQAAGQQRARLFTWEKAVDSTHAVYLGM